MVMRYLENQLLLMNIINDEYGYSVELRQMILKVKKGEYQ